MNDNRETLRVAAQKLTDRDERFLTLLSELKAAVAVTAEQVSGVREDMIEIKKAANEDRADTKENRRIVNETLDHTTARIVEMESTVRTIGGLVDKATNRIDKLEPTVKATARTVRVWTIRGGIVATAVLAVGGFMYANGATIWKAIRAVLPS